jgi:hypothetical protein
MATAGVVRLVCARKTPPDRTALLGQLTKNERSTGLGSDYRHSRECDKSLPRKPGVQSSRSFWSRVAPTSCCSWRTGSWISRSYLAFSPTAGGRVHLHMRACPGRVSSRPQPTPVRHTDEFIRCKSGPANVIAMRSPTRPGEIARKDRRMPAVLELPDAEERPPGIAPRSTPSVQAFAGTRSHSQRPASRAWSKRSSARAIGGSIP